MRETRKTKQKHATGSEKDISLPLSFFWLCITHSFYAKKIYPKKQETIENFVGLMRIAYHFSISQYRKLNLRNKGEIKPSYDTLLPKKCIVYI